MFALRPAERVAVCPERALICRGCGDGSPAERCCCRRAISWRPGSGDWTTDSEGGGDIRQDAETVNSRRKVLVDALLIDVAIPRCNHIRTGLVVTEFHFVHQRC